MKKLFYIIILLLAAGCTSQKKLAYLNNLSETEQESFPMNIEDYRLQPRDVLLITLKAMNPEGKIEDLLPANIGVMSTGDPLLYGYEVDLNGYITMPVIGSMEVKNLTIDEAKKAIQVQCNRVFKNATVECRMLSFRITVLGEVNSPGPFNNYSRYITVMEAIGKAGGIGDRGDRRNLLIIRTSENSTKTFRVNLQDKELLTSDKYMLQPNDLIIVQPMYSKVFDLNSPTISFVLSAVASSLSLLTLILVAF